MKDSQTHVAINFFFPYLFRSNSSILNYLNKSVLHKPKHLIDSIANVSFLYRVYQLSQDTNRPSSEVTRYRAMLLGTDIRTKINLTHSQKNISALVMPNTHHFKLDL